MTPRGKIMAADLPRVSAAWPRALWLGTVAGLLLMQAACGPRSEDRRSPQAKAEPDPTAGAELGIGYSSKKGLSIAPETARFIGLAAAEVQERRLSSALAFGGQVYAVASHRDSGPLAASTAQASGAVAPPDALKLKPGQTATIRLPGDSEGMGMAGRIEGLRRDLERAQGQVEVLVSFASPPSRVAPGAAVIVSVMRNSAPGSVSVPKSAVLRTSEGDFVYTTSGDRFVRTHVVLGVMSQDWAEVTEGLYAGDEVVTHPVMTLWMAELQSLRGGKACADGH